MEPGSLEWIQMILVLLAIGAALFLLMKQVTEVSSRKTIKVTKAYTLEACGDKVERRDHKEGDYVGMVSSTCPDGTPKRVVGIYIEEIQQRI